jgi:hypothetical protein
MSPRAFDHLDEDAAERPSQRAAAVEPDPSYRLPESENILRRVIEIIDGSPGMPMSASVRVNKDEVLELLEDAVERLPEELRSARWLLKEREEYVARYQRDADDLIAEAKSQVAHMVQRTEVSKAAEVHAQQIVERAEARARRLMREAEDYCDQKLASFENVLGRITKTVHAGRARLSAPTIEQAELGESEGPLSGSSPAATGAPVFDQDH